MGDEINKYKRAVLILLITAYPDGKPFVIRRTDTNQSALILNEIDRDTESQAKFKDKLKAWGTIWQSGAYKKYGHKGALLRIVTTSDYHMGKLMEWTQDVLDKPTYAIFGRVFDHTVLGSKSPVNFDQLTQLYQRVGHPPISLITLSVVQKEAA